MRTFKLSMLPLVLLSICALNSARAAEPVHSVTFTDYAEGSIQTWLETKGFEFQRDAKRRDRIDLDVSSDGLTLEAKKRAFGMLTNESVDVPEFTHVEIDWGVTNFPEGASYEQEVRNEALLVILFMGDERQPSGSVFIRNSPYFVGLFLCHGDDRLHHPYIGAYFKKSGRYVCLDRPAEGELITSRFNLMEAYQAYFDQERDDDPAVSGLALEVDTKKAGEGGIASAFIHEIRFYR